MANKTIPDLNEIDVGDVSVDQLMVLDSGLETFKIRMSTLLEFLGTAGTYFYTDTIGWDGTETVSYNVSTLVDDNGNTISDAVPLVWQLKRDDGGGAFTLMQGYAVTHASASDVTITFGDDFPPDAGTYVLIGR